METSAVKTFEECVGVIDRLLGPGGCPWDQEQTMASMRESLLEEACEFIEAVDLGDTTHMSDELGDLFFLCIFFGRLAEKEGRFTVNEALEGLKDKLIRRHPHVFGEVELEDTEAIVEQWERLKTHEKNHSHRKSALDGIPKGLPALARAQKVLKRLKKQGANSIPTTPSQSFASEQDLGEALLALVASAQESGLDAEAALRHTLSHLERKFREQELL